MSTLLPELVSGMAGYLNERENIRIRKLAGKPWPWTEDPILQTYSFTNVLREDDRTSKWVIENWYVPNHNRDPAVQLYNCGVFRYFGTREFAQAIGWQETYDPKLLIDIAAQRLENKETVFTGAYVITNQGIKAPKQEVVANIFLKGLWEAAPHLCEVFQVDHHWEDVFHQLSKRMGFGGTGFMAKEVLQDAMFTAAMPRDQVKDRLTFSPAGPGAQRGLNRLHDRPLDKKVPLLQAIDEMVELRKRLMKKFEDPRYGIMFGVEENFDLHAVQFALCEYDKYLRVLYGEGRPRKKYRRKA